ncbi:MAG: uroporphyrinogen decarboxylase family protein [Actinomycetota bacterium]
MADDRRFIVDSRERIETAIRLGKPDRVPVVPIIDFFSARYGGITQHEMLFDVKKADEALEKTLRELGSIDGQHLSYAGLGRIMQLFFPTPPVMPGVGGEPPDGQFQFVEKTVMGPEEYLQIEKRGPLRWVLDKMKLSNPELGKPQGLLGAFGKAFADIARIKRSVSRWRGKGVESLVAFNIVFTPLEYISLFMRSFNEFSLDLFRRPEEVKQASRALMPFMKKQGSLMIRMSGIRRVFMGGTRTSASFLSPRQFEEFALPEWKEMCEFWTARGVTPILHFDSDWTAFFPYLKELPRGKCVLNLDGTSDVFAAKEQLGGHMCIMGDVPATLLKLGEPEEVDEYCRRLITELGSDGGFILSSGCTIPVDAKPENVRAMLASVHRYRP